MTAVYLDNCCFNRPFDDQLHPIVQMETRAKLLIQADIVLGKLKLIWSFMLSFENNDNPYRDRKEQIGRWEAIASQAVSYTSQIEAQANSIIIINPIDFLRRYMYGN